MKENTDTNLYNELYKSIKSLNKALNGDPDNRYDQGIIGDVARNTRFRLFMERILWIIVIGFLSFGSYVIIHSNDVLSEMQTLKKEIVSRK